MRFIGMIILGLGLLVFWVLEMLSPVSSTGVATGTRFNSGAFWTEWFDILFAVLAFVGARKALLLHPSWAVSLAIGLLLIFRIGESGGAPSWMSWGNLVFALAFAALVILSPRAEKQTKLSVKKAA